LFDGFAEAFWQYQAEMTKPVQTSTNPTLNGLEPERESEKSEETMPDSARGSVFLKIDGGRHCNQFELLVRRILRSKCTPRQVSRNRKFTGIRSWNCIGWE